MSTNNPIAGPSTDNFTAIFNAAENEYQTITGKSLKTHPFATQLETCQNPDAVLNLLQTQAQAFSKFRKGDEKLMAWLNPTIHILSTFSDTLGEGISLPFSPAKTIVTGIGVLLGAVKDVVASHDTLIQLFERINFFLQRLKRYTGIPLTNESRELLGKIMAQLLLILALSTKAMTERRISEKNPEEASGKDRRRGCAFTTGYAYEGGEFDDASEEPGGYTPRRWRRP
ncbi:hypothetical protein BJV77DRAFT_93040 [Russula vinacea]|nr:hypothetical protein BJV77DRAFT_93040 [Russula vinacea]